MMNKVLIVVTLLLFNGHSLFGAAQNGESSGVASKPNILFILIDDFGWKDVGYNGSTFYETPEIDELSKEWMRFDNCYTPSPMCSPTRVSIMTGKNPARHGVTQWLPGLGEWPGHSVQEQVVLCPRPEVQSIDKNEITLGEALQCSGYETAFYGKWHMGSFELSGGPQANGFDSQKAVIEANRCRMFYPFWDIDYFPDAKPGDYYTDLLTESAIEFIGEKRDKPFFLYLAHFAMHAPIASKEAELQKFTEKAKRLPTLTDEENRIDDPYAHKPYKRRQDSPDYAGELANLDENIGKLVQSLKDKDLYDNTIIILTGDNGGRTSVDYSERSSSYFAPPTAVQPLRAGKTFTFDGGLRTPLLIHWPGVTKKGTNSDRMVTSMDFYPTILEMLGLPMKPEQHLDGVSLVSLLTGKDIDRNTLYWHFPHYQGEGSYPTSAICKGNYKLIVNYHQQDELLFDVFNDMGEENNLAPFMRDKVESMKEELMNYLNEVGAYIPESNPDLLSR